MSRLPIPGEDNGSWGGILNDFLLQAHKTDGALKDDAVTATSLADGSVSTANIAAGGIALSAVTNLSSILASKYTLPGTGIPKADLASSVQTSLTTADARDAIKIQGASISGAPGAAHQVLTATSTTTANWQIPSTFISIVDYGAACDGTTDDTSAIQAALTACPTGGTVIHPGGTSLISNMLIMKDRTAFRGNSEIGSVIKLKSGSSTSLLAMLSTASFTNGGTTVGLNVSIADLYFDGNVAGNASSTIDGIRTLNWRTTIRGVEVWNCGGHGIHLRNYNSAGVALTNTMNEARIEACTTASNNGAGIYIEDDGNKITDGFLINNVSYANHGTSQISFDNTAGWLIQGNHTYNGTGYGGHGMVLKNVFASRIVNNYIDGFGANTATATYYGMYVLVSGGISRGSVVAGNCITGNDSVAANTFQYLVVTTPASSTGHLVLAANTINGNNGTNTNGVNASAGSGSTLTIEDQGNQIFNVTTPVTTFSGVSIVQSSLTGAAGGFDLTATHTFSGANTFTAATVVPTPTAPTQAATKAYADTLRTTEPTVTRTGNYTADIADAGVVQEFNTAGATAFTIPPTSTVNFPVGTILKAAQLGTGAVTLTPGSGVTLLKPRSLISYGQYASFWARKESASAGAAAVPVTNLVLRYVADDIAGADGSAVSSWPEASGGPAATQATGGAQPTLVAAGPNGHKAVNFNGVGQFLSLSGAALAIGNNVSALNIMIIYGYPTTVSGVRTAFAISSGTSSTSNRAFIQKPTNGFWSTGGRRLDADAGVASVTGSVGPVNGEWGVVSARLINSAASANIYKNGTLIGGPTTYQTAGTTSATNSLAGAIGSNTLGTAEFFAGRIVEILVYNADISTPQRQSVHSYIQDKYAITVSDYSNTGEVWLCGGDLA